MNEKQEAIEALDRLFDRCEEIEKHLPEGDPDKEGYSMYPDYIKVRTYLTKDTGHTVSEWTPLTDHEPEKDGEYLVSFDDEFVATTGYYDGDFELWADAGEPVAWMPTPAPYKPPKEEISGRTAHWEISSDGHYLYCSACKREQKSHEQTMFCPHCGTRMIFPTPKKARKCSAISSLTSAAAAGMPLPKPYKKKGVRQEGEGNAAD